MIYDYMCPKCKQTLEVTHGSGEKCRMCCITCKKLFKKIFSSVSFVLKGVGFYGRGRT